MGGESLNAAPREREVLSPHRPHLNTDKVFQNSITDNNTKFTDILTKTVIGVVSLKTVLTALLHNVFSFLIFNGHAHKSQV
jgi:hypothetical protein